MQNNQKKILKRHIGELERSLARCEGIASVREHLYGSAAKSALYHIDIELANCRTRIEKIHKNDDYEDSSGYERVIDIESNIKEFRKKIEEQ